MEQAEKLTLRRLTMNLMHDTANANLNLDYIPKVVARERNIGISDSEILNKIVGLVERNMLRNREALDIFYTKLKEEELLPK